MNAPAHLRSAGPVVGLDAIGELFGRSRYTIRRWIEHQDFPASCLTLRTSAPSQKEKLATSGGVDVSQNPVRPTEL